MLLTHGATAPAKLDYHKKFSKMPCQHVRDQVYLSSRLPVHLNVDLVGNNIPSSPSLQDGFKMPHMVGAIEAEAGVAEPEI